MSTGSEPNRRMTNEEKCQRYLQKYGESMPPVLYRYLDHDGADKTLANRQIQFKCPLAFNDPFDCQWNPLWPLTTSEGMAAAEQAVREAIQIPPSGYAATSNAWVSPSYNSHRARLDTTRRQFQELPASEREPFLDRQCAARTDIPSYFENNLLFSCSQLRVVCMTTEPESLHMWAHFAEKHTGVVIGFDTSKLIRSMRMVPQPVEYFDSMPALIDPLDFCRSFLKGDSPPDFGPLIDAWPRYKHTTFKPEKEWRFVYKDPTPDRNATPLQPFSGEALSEVYVGCRAEDQAARQIATLARECNPSVRVYRMRPDRTQFLLNKERMDTLLI